MQDSPECNLPESVLKSTQSHTSRLPQGVLTVPSMSTTMAGFDSSACLSGPVRQYGLSPFFNILVGRAAGAAETGREADGYCSALTEHANNARDKRCLG